jgi:hypothetical protein
MWYTDFEGRSSKITFFSLTSKYDGLNEPITEDDIFQVPEELGVLPKSEEIMVLYRGIGLDVDFAKLHQERKLLIKNKWVSSWSKSFDSADEFGHKLNLKKQRNQYFSVL